MSFTITRVISPGTSGLGLRFRFSPEHSCLVVASVAETSPFFDQAIDDDDDTCLIPGMHVFSINNFETCDEFMASNIDSIIARLQGEVIITAALPPPVQVTRTRKVQRDKPVGLHLGNTPNKEIFIAKIARGSIFEYSDLAVGMLVLSVNGIGVDDGQTTAAQAERWLERSKGDISIRAQLYLASLSPSSSANMGSSSNVQGGNAEEEEEIYIPPQEEKKKRKKHKKKSKKSKRKSRRKPIDLSTVEILFDDTEEDTYVPPPPPAQGLLRASTLATIFDDIQEVEKGEEEYEDFVPPPPPPPTQLVRAVSSWSSKALFGRTSSRALFGGKSQRIIDHGFGVSTQESKRNLNVARESEDHASGDDTPDMDYPSRTNQSRSRSSSDSSYQSLIDSSDPASDEFDDPPTRVDQKVFDRLFDAEDSDEAPEETPKIDSLNQKKVDVEPRSAAISKPFYPSLDERDADHLPYPPLQRADKQPSTRLAKTPDSDNFIKKPMESDVVAAAVAELHSSAMPVEACQPIGKHVGETDSESEPLEVVDETKESNQLVEIPDLDQHTNEPPKNDIVVADSTSSHQSVEERSVSDEHEPPSFADNKDANILVDKPDVDDSTGERAKDNAPDIVSQDVAVAAAESHPSKATTEEYFPSLDNGDSDVVDQPDQLDDSQGVEIVSERLLDKYQSDELIDTRDIALANEPIENDSPDGAKEDAFGMESYSARSSEACDLSLGNRDSNDLEDAPQQPTADHQESGGLVVEEEPIVLSTDNASENQAPIEKIEGTGEQEVVPNTSDDTVAEVSHEGEQFDSQPVTKQYPPWAGRNPNQPNLYLQELFGVDANNRRKRRRRVDIQGLVYLVQDAMAEQQWQSALLAILEHSSEPVQSRLVAACFYTMKRYRLVARTVQNTPWIPSLESLLAPDGACELEWLQSLDNDFHRAMDAEGMLVASYMLSFAMESAALIPMKVTEILDFSLRCILVRYYAVKEEFPDFYEFAGKYLLDDDAFDAMTQDAVDTSPMDSGNQGTPWESINMRNLVTALQTATHISSSAELPYHERLVMAWEGRLSILQLAKSLYRSVIKKSSASKGSFNREIAFGVAVPTFADFPVVAGDVCDSDSPPKKSAAEHLSQDEMRQMIDLSAPSAVSKANYNRMRKDKTSIVSVPLNFKLLSGPFPRLTARMPSVKAFREGLKQLDWCIQGHNLLLKYHIGLSTLFTRCCGFPLRTVLRECQGYIRGVLDEYKAAMDEDISPEETAKILQMNWPDKKKDVVDLVRGFFQACHSPLALILLEEECNRTESGIREGQPDEFDKVIFNNRSVESTKRCVAAYATLVLSVSRLCLCLVDFSYAFYAASRPVKDSTDVYNETAQSCFTMIQSITSVLRSDQELYKPLSLAQVATLFFSQSHPRGQRVFLSHRGPDLKMALLNFVETNKTDFDSTIYRRHSRYPISFFLDCATPSIAETNNCFLYRELWESTHLHVFYSRRFAESEWCRREVFAWRLIANQQAWRRTTITYDEGEQNPASRERERDVFGGRAVTDLPPLGSHESMFRDNFVVLKRLLPVENDKSTLDGVDMDEMTRTDFQRIFDGLLDFKAAHESFVGSMEEQQALFIRSCAMLRQAMLRQKTWGDEDGPSSEEMKSFGQLWESLHENCLPGSDDFLWELSSIRHGFGPRVCWGNEAPFYILRAYHLARGCPDKPGSRALFVHLDQLFVVCANFAILTCDEDVDLFLEVVEQLHSTDDSVREGIAARLRIRHDTDLPLTRIALLLFASGMSSVPFIVQLRSDPITENVVAGITFQILPCVTGDTWDEVEQLVQLRATNRAYEEDDLPTPEEKLSTEQ